MSPIDVVSSQMANVSISAPTSENKANQIEVAASVIEGRRLYIGNLAYVTTDDQLRDFFSCYDVESTSIPTNPRTSRPLGFAFVDLKSSEDAERAVSELNGQSFLERKVSIQLAHKPNQNGEFGLTGESNYTRRRFSSRGRGRGRGGRSFRGTRNYRKDNTETGATIGELNNVSAPQVLPLSDVTNIKLTTSKGNEGKKPSDINKNFARPRITRERRQRGPPEDGVPSKTKIMVANLPYDFREDKLLELFKDYSPSAAKIALRPIPKSMVKKLLARGEPRKGRGFGFVTLASEEMQLKACEEMNGKEVEGREIAVKVAIDSPGKEDTALGGTTVEPETLTSVTNEATAVAA